MLFRAADLTGARRVTAEVSRTGAGRARLELWADAVGAGGTLLAAPAVPSTGRRYAWTTVAAELSGDRPGVPSGVHDLHLVLIGEFRLAAFGLAP